MKKKVNNLLFELACLPARQVENSILTVFIIVIIFFSLPAKAGAADLEVTFEIEPLFSQTADSYWYPGRSKTRWVVVKNNSSEDKTVIVETLNEITSDSVWDLAKVLEIAVSTGGTDIYGGNLGTKYLSEFYTVSELSLSTLSPAQSVIYDFTVFMDESLSNDWQDKDTGFDLKIGFLAVTPTSTPTPEPTATPTPTPIGVVAGAAIRPVKPIIEFIKEILGEVTPLTSPTVILDSEVKGAKVSPIPFWWIIIFFFIIAIVLLLIYYYFRSRYFRSHSR